MTTAFITTCLDEGGGVTERDSENEHRQYVWPTSNFAVGHDRTPESAGNAAPIDLTGRAD